ncbi:MAG: STAS domain-containing protein [Solirubrobacteraceae bacterium]
MTAIAEVSGQTDVTRVVPSGLGIALTEQGTTSTIALAGECDLACQQALRDAVGEALYRRPECLVLDLCLLSFIDSTGIQVVVETARRASRQDTRLVIIPGPRAVHRVFEICQLTEMLPFTPQTRRNREAPQL